MVLKRLVLSLLLLSVLMVVSDLSAKANAESGGETEPKTSPPPNSFQLFGVFDTYHLYLDNGFNTAKDNGSHVIKVEVTTIASSTVNQIGAKLYIEQWDGSNWNLVGSVINLSTTNTDEYVGSHSKTVTGGYYYRARTVHWIQHGVYEDGERTGGFVYVK
ncbi:hypothetical protein [Paenibacillus eucommiae]|uniref:Uncharacterized protein n=1 Tax=Paenibacillus eucommiae TaxID=1355755 RepID=A0ABS4J3D5_9BACL|nr:hypothetical protein [Paenibacillus eucommiae]MBP1994318.1 hypothetical protein [Paenibacillus eucommiae]